MLEIKKIKRSYCVVSGISILGKFRSLKAAEKSLIEDSTLYTYWAGSCAVSVENTPPNIKKI
jgi:hypothetical protein